ncbi:hypothetical protein CHS0354_038945 [Potamilus streckersoni]|uniref:Uncharacterized protein n=1 Tax=Potamilus streckersoni TaxID=2493646 RepID=A0AAE0VMG2_9BIVA|nr:hypothetical protein CHS0354_038945 [Potamilus streckersoni]
MANCKRMSCTVSPICNCSFGNVEEQASGNEVLAGVVAALGSVVVAGAGLGAWNLIQSRRGSVEGLYSRSASSLSNESIMDRRDGTKDPPPSYKDRPRRGSGFDRPDCESPRGSADLDNTPRTTNIYRAGMNDNLNLRVGGRGISTPSLVHSKSDWTVPH